METPPEITSLAVRCHICGATATVGEVNSDKQRFYLENGNAIAFMGETTQERINRVKLTCELCQEERDEDDLF